MTLEQYIAKLKELKDRAERAAVHGLPSLEHQAYALVVEFMNTNVDTTGGNLVANAQATAALNNFADVFTSAFTELADYRGNVSSYLKNFKPIADLIKEFQASMDVDVARANVGEAQNVVLNEIVNQYSENGLNPGFVQPMRDLLYNNVSGGLNKNQAMQQVRDYISSDKDTTGKLGRYLEQTAQQGVDSYTGATNVRIMQTFSIDTMVMSGSLIATSSPQCRYCVNELQGVLDRAAWPDIKDIATGNGLIKGTTFDNLPFNKLHWGCRHEFTPAALSQADRENITQTSTNE